MQRLTTPTRSFLVGDEAVELLLELAALTARIGGGESVKFRALNIDGDDVIASILLNAGTLLVAETTTSAHPEPDNIAMVEYVRARLNRFTFTGVDWDAPVVSNASD